ncbi:phosphate ABC transporter permease subunit PstC [uncultured Methanobrevibacter sp.]|uniref:phosphate ABC transporter permease subunit PstC n=1 Tax=uncultured Methanobrevibacter sp. TaxID=253161 RepID=UPI00263803D2|nr:phosphate ABC transporter permease subunit PstC [uncultured Methanobrevibacter sp.]
METKNFSEFLIEKGLFITAIFSILVIFIILAFIVSEAIPAFQDYGFFQFLTGSNWAPNEGQFGVFPMIVGSIFVTLLSLVIAVPLSLLCAIFMEEIAPDKIKLILKPVIQTLSGIPSVVYGFFGLTVLVPIVRQNFGGTGFSVFTAALILSVMILPTIISVSQDAIKAVPSEYKEAALGLGSTNWQTIRHIIVPSALPGIITAIILGIGRAIGETLAVIMVAGNVAQIPGSIFAPVRTLTTNIALEMGYATGLHYNALFGTAVVLFIIIAALLLVANYVQNKYGIGAEGIE